MYKEGNLVLLGLDAAGKTTLLGILKNNHLKQAIPTNHATKEEFAVGRVKFGCFDVGGHVEVRKLWETYFPAIAGIVFIVDSADRSRIEEASIELQKVLAHESAKSVPVLILGNKIDLPTAYSEEELKYRLGVTLTTGKNTTSSDLKEKGIRPIEVFMCSVVLRQGFGEGFKWLANHF